jgi:hypothetical protein
MPDSRMLPSVEMISENMKLRRKVYLAALVELHSIDPDVDPVAFFDEPFAAARVAAQARALRPDRDDLSVDS